ncbi:hypothetical protein IAQ61_000474 [Plenodomus lingam]|uniref:uncharacterized protein n=1 Tax=Leptosphaeria maculans TaxID=5022 RepID=UPI003321E85C|nr:hypothetical protein IAQ61_000474 [Plenodomus lingam]
MVKMLDALLKPLNAVEPCPYLIVKAADEDDHLRWIDGYNQHCAGDPTYQKPLAEIGGSGVHGCRRDQLLEELAKYIPPGLIAFNKRLDELQQESDGKVFLGFVDGSTFEFDAGMTLKDIHMLVRLVVGADKIQSSVATAANRTFVNASWVPATPPHSHSTHIK